MLLSKSKLLLFFFSLSFIAYSQQEKTEILIGKWDFVELTDSNNNRIDTIWHSFIGGYEIASGPTIILRPDFTFETIFTPKDIDKGEWSYNKMNNELINRLYLDENIPTSKYLIQTGKAKQYANGSYYEELKYKIIVLEEDRMVLKEREGFREYRKVR